MTQFPRVCEVCPERRSQILRLWHRTAEVHHSFKYCWAELRNRVRKNAHKLSRNGYLSRPWLVTCGILWSPSVFFPPLNMVQRLTSKKNQSEGKCWEKHGASREREQHVTSLYTCAWGRSQLNQSHLFNYTEHKIAKKDGGTLHRRNIVHQSEVGIQYGQLQLLRHVAPLIDSRK